MKTRIGWFLLGAFVAGIAAIVIMWPQTRMAPEIHLDIQIDNSGQIISISTFYLSAGGGNVLHGERHTWETPARKRIEKFRNGVKTEGYWESVNYVSSNARPAPPK